MCTPTRPIAVTGATGQLGGRIARRLASAAVPQRLLVRDPTRAPELPARPSSRRPMTMRTPSGRR